MNLLQAGVGIPAIKSLFAACPIPRGLDWRPEASVGVFGNKIDGDLAPIKRNFFLPSVVIPRCDQGVLQGDRQVGELEIASNTTRPGKCDLGDVFAAGHLPEKQWRARVDGFSNCEISELGVAWAGTAELSSVSGVK